MGLEGYGTSVRGIGFKHMVSVSPGLGVRLVGLGLGEVR